MIRRFLCWLDWHQRPLHEMWWRDRVVLGDCPACGVWIYRLAVLRRWRLDTSSSPTQTNQETPGDD